VEFSLSLIDLAVLESLWLLSVRFGDLGCGFSTTITKVIEQDASSLLMKLGTWCAGDAHFRQSLCCEERTPFEVGAVLAVACVM